MPDNTKLLQALKEEKERVLPTPPIGHSVQWFEAGNTKNPFAAVVTQVEGPGRVELTVFKARSSLIYKQGVLHVTAEEHKVPGNPTTVRCGSWDYPLGKYPREHSDFHLQDIAKRYAEAERTHVPTPKPEKATKPETANA